MDARIWLSDKVHGGLRRVRHGVRRTMLGHTTLHFIHIGKTGGTAISDTMKNKQVSPTYVIEVHSHRFKLRDFPPGEKVFFIVRDPVSRFLSAFSSRKRQGRPRHFTPWTPEEAEAFSTFEDADALATALGSDDPARVAAAERAMSRIVHVRDTLKSFLGSPELFRKRLDDVFFIGFQESLDEDFARFCGMIGARGLSLPTDPVASHRSPADARRPLSEVGRANLRRWYATDYELLGICREIAEMRGWRRPAAP